MRTLYFDCFAGISGDMTLGALLGAGADEERLRGGLSLLGLSGFSLEVGRRMAGPIAATDVRVVLDDHGHHHHRRLGEIRQIIQAAELSDRVKQTALGIFTRLAVAEGRVHGHAPEEVHFHEVGALDAIVDIIGASLCLETLGWPKVVASPMPTFHGYARGSHGTFPLPAPATAELLRGVPWRKLDIEGELVTPTGAAIITQIAERFGEMPAMKVDGIGYGAGKSDFGIPNALRVLIGSEEEATGAAGSVAVIETNIDDLNPQFYERAVERLFSAGALDVFLSPVQMKKGRPGTLLTALCDPGRVRELAEIVLAETSTFGVRIARRERICLERRWEEVSTEFGPVRIKIGELNGRPLTASPEYEECKKAADRHGVPVRLVHEAALTCYRVSRKP